MCGKVPSTCTLGAHVKEGSLLTGRKPSCLSLSVFCPHAPFDGARCYAQVLELARMMFKKCHLVHADLSEYNVLYHEKVRCSGYYIQRQFSVGSLMVVSGTPKCRRPETPSFGAGPRDTC